MRLKTLNLKHYRNYTSLSLTFNSGLTILTGENAQGKTNLLEAIFLLAMARSHRTPVDRELIQWGEEIAKIEGMVEKEHISYPLELTILKDGKVARFNYMEQSKLSSFIGQLNVVLFAPEDLQLVKGAPSVRRRFIDAELAQAHPIYLQELLAYNKILKQRNYYLRDMKRQPRQFDPLLFEVMTEQLIEKAVKVIQYRLEFVEKLNHYAQPLHEHLSNQRDHLSIVYKSSSSRLDYESSSEALTEQFRELFQSSNEREREQGFTLYGPHRDDLIFYLNDKLAQDFGSQGQQRTIVLSIKLAEIELFKEMTQEYPILLLDDVLSELDDQRQRILMEQIQGRVQTFLTTASIEGLPLDQLNETDIYYIEAGTVTQRASKGE